MKILFVCKHNIYRSRIAEEHMKKISNHEIDSAGLISFSGKVPKTHIISSAKYGLNLDNKSKTLSVELLNEQDLVIIVADDVPIEVFKNPVYKFGEVRKWGIEDVNHLDMTHEEVEGIIEQIIKKVEELENEISNN